MHKNGCDDKARVKASAGRYFEDFAVGDVIRHATPRTIGEGEIALYAALYGTQFAPQSSAPFAAAIGYPARPVDDLLVFHTVFGKSVPDVSLNAVANLGYAEGRFLRPVFAGDTLSASSVVIGLKENSSRETGVVYVRTTGENQRGEPVLSFVRWVMVNKRDTAAPAPPPTVPTLAPYVEPATLADAVPNLIAAAWDPDHAGSACRHEDYAVGERIDHLSGVTIEEAEHQIATRLYQNTARVHFDQLAASAGRTGRRLVYGGVAMSIARALSFNGLAPAFHVAAINGGRHVAPCFAGDTLYAASIVLDRAGIGARTDVGALRVRLLASKNRPMSSYGSEIGTAPYPDGIVLDLDLWLVLPR